VRCQGNSKSCGHCAAAFDDNDSTVALLANATAVVNGPPNVHPTC